jgi:hypothetical protein
VFGSWQMSLEVCAFGCPEIGRVRL